MRYLINFSYDGTNFYGYQKQIDKRTVQGEIEKVLFKIYNKDISISASGRTDALVHALNQYAHFDLDKNVDINLLKRSLNCLLPADIYVKKINIVENDFHARFNVVAKEYIYKINLGEYNPLKRNYVYQYNKPLNIEKMCLAIQYFKGVHNFKSFTKNNILITDYVREIYDTQVTVDNNELTIYFKGNGFLRYMVRNMVGTLIEIGQDKKNAEDIIKIINCEDRTKAGKIAPANGLYLQNVFYS